MLGGALYIIDTPLTSLSSCLVCYAVGKVVRTSITDMLEGALYISSIPL